MCLLQMLQNDICKCSSRMQQLLLVNSEQYPPSPGKETNRA